MEKIEIAAEDFNSVVTEVLRDSAFDEVNSALKYANFIIGDEDNSKEDRIEAFAILFAMKDIVDKAYPKAAKYFEIVGENVVEG